MAVVISILHGHGVMMSFWEFGAFAPQQHVMQEVKDMSEKYTRKNSCIPVTL